MPLENRTKGGGNGMLVLLTRNTKILSVMVVRSMSSLVGGRTQYGKSCWLAGWLAREILRDKADDVLRCMMDNADEKCTVDCRDLGLCRYSRFWAVASFVLRVGFSRVSTRVESPECGDDDDDYDDGVVRTVENRENRVTVILSNQSEGQT
jgi:hypothetical protein